MQAFALFLFLIFSINAFSQEKQTVPWAVTDWSPFYILKGPSQDDGKMDRLRKVLEEQLPQYSFVPITADSPRLIELWQINKNVCSGATIKTPEREKWAYFTAFVHQSPAELVLFTAKPELFKAKGNLSFAQILKDKNLKGIFAQNRSYGLDNDQLILEAADSVRVQIFPEGYKSLYKMVEKKRYDYSIEYATVVRAYSEGILPAQPLSIFQLKESEEPMVFYFSCTKNEWGRKVAQTVDQAMQSLAKTTKYRQAAESYIAPDQIKKQRATMDEFYEKRAKGPWTTAPENELPVSDE